jgi:predicted nuclease of predicted toxin-antitoxin system
VKLLADENLHSHIVAWLRSQGHDVLYAAETLSRTSDDELLSIARDEDRILMTADKDFGELVFHRRLISRSIVLIRLSTLPISQRLERLAKVWPCLEEQAHGKFIVISDQKVRVRGMPDRA